MIWTGLSQYRDCGILIVRIGLGVCFMFHGFPKLAGGPAGWHQIGGTMGLVGIHFLPTFWGFMAASAEFFGGLLFAMGLLFRPVCLILVFQMFMAIQFHLHARPPLNTFGAGYSHALENGLVFLGFFFIGPGKYSVDRK